MKMYVLEELYIMESGKYWRTIISGSDLRGLRKLKKEYEKKFKYNDFRIVEIK